MADVAPEERAASNIVKLADFADPVWINDFRRRVHSEIRAAVAAQQERDAKLAEAPRRIMPLHGESIADTVAFTQRCIAAAIRGGER